MMINYLLSKDLGSILNFIDRLQSLDTEEVDPIKFIRSIPCYERRYIIDKNS